MVKKALALLVGVAVLGAALGVFGLFWPALVEAQSPAASRSLSPATVMPGGEITVTITLSNVAEGRVEETLPMGFEYVQGSASEGIRARPDPADNQTMRFTLRGDIEFSYKVTASDTADEYTFMGVLKAVIGGGDSVETVDVTGDSMVTVEMAMETPETPVTPETMDPTATRAISPATVTAGGQFTVTVNVSNLGSGGGRVEETLPSGLGYVDDSVSPSDIRVTTVGQTVRFTIRGTNRFTYRVNAHDVGTHTIVGTLRDDDRNRYMVGGDASVTVQVRAMPSGPNATRSLSAMSVVPGGELTVTVAVSGLGGPGGRVEETLPTGFSYVEDSVMPSDVRVSMAGGAVRFTIRGTDQFSYKVMASRRGRQLLLHGRFERRPEDGIHGDRRFRRGGGSGRQQDLVGDDGQAGGRVDGDDHRRRVRYGGRKNRRNAAQRVQLRGRLGERGRYPGYGAGPDGAVHHKGDREFHLWGHGVEHTGRLHFHGCPERRGQDHTHGRRGQQRDGGGAGHGYARANANQSGRAGARRWWRRRRVRPAGSDGYAHADAGSECGRGDDSADAHADNRADDSSADGRANA